MRELSKSLLGRMGNQEVRTGKGLRLLGVGKWLSFSLHRKANKWLADEALHHILHNKHSSSSQKKGAEYRTSWGKSRSLDGLALKVALL